MQDWDEMAAVGRIARAHGIRGQVIVNLDTDFPEARFQPGAELFIERDRRVEPLTITTVRFQQGRPVIGLRGVDDMNAAIALAGTELRVPRQWLAALPTGTFYRHDLVGCQVETSDGRPIGVVSAVEGDQGGSRLVVDTPDGELLVPLAAEICPTIDPAARRIVIAPPEGLLELNQNRRSVRL
ncbi:MAG TPA: ribosome maturation factor RimM [Vicinamibacterales bacterium]|jgi:16S rRNA processing protein RimM